MQFVHPVLGAREVDELVNFYQRLGFTVVFQDTPTRPRYVGIRRDAVELHIQWADAGQWSFPVDRPVFRFLVDDVDALYAEWVDSGALTEASTQGSPWSRPKDTPWGTREFHLRDASQNGLQFYRPL